MIKHLSIFRMLFFIPLLLTACGEEKKQPKKQLTTEQVKEVSQAMNEWDRQRQNDEINQYTKNHGWDMQMTGSGLRWMLLKKGTGAQAKSGMTAVVNYRIILMDGTECYSSKKDGAESFLIDQDHVESGLHEGIQLMHVGDEMRFILPSHLAHGLSGDENCIPPRSSVVYEITLLELK